MIHLDLTGKILLVADDEPIIREILVEHLEGLGAKVISAEHGNHAWELLQTQTVDLILSDVRMPGGDGLELLQRLKASGKPMPAFFFLTGYSDFNLEEAKAQGATSAISKPFKLEHLERSIAQALGLTTDRAA